MKDKTHEFMTNNDYEKLKQRYFPNHSTKIIKDYLTTNLQNLAELKRDELKNIVQFFRDEKNIDSRLSANKPDFITRIQHIMQNNGDSPLHSTNNNNNIWRPKPTTVVPLKTSTTLPSSSTTTAVPPPPTTTSSSSYLLFETQPYYHNHNSSYTISSMSPVPTATAPPPTSIPYVPTTNTTNTTTTTAYSNALLGNTTPTTPSLLSPLYYPPTAVAPQQQRFTFQQVPRASAVKVEEIQTSQRSLEFTCRKLTIEEQLRWNYFQQDCSLKGQVSPFVEIEQLIEFKFIHPNSNSLLLDLHALDTQKVRLLQNSSQQFELQILLFQSTDKTQFKPMNWPNDSNVKCNGSVLSIPKINKKLNKKDTDALVVADPLVIPSAVLQPGNLNRISLTTQQILNNALFIVVFVKKFSVDTLADGVRNKQNTVTKPTFYYQYKQQMNETNNNNEDDDLIIEDKEIMSLRDPVSLKKIKEATKGINCGHKQCFDLKTYLNYCQISKLWNCPFCDKRAHYSELFIVDSMNKILNETAEEADKIVLNPDGSYELLENPLTNKPSSSTSKSSTLSTATTVAPAANLTNTIALTSTSAPVLLVIDEHDTNANSPEQLHHGNSPESDLSLNYSDDEDELLATPQKASTHVATPPRPTSSAAVPIQNTAAIKSGNDGKTWSSAIEIE